MNKKNLFWGLLTRRERVGLSLKGWLLLVLLIGGTFVLWVFNVRSFLAQNRRVNSDVIVMEGWLQDYAVREAAAEFIKSPGHKIYTTGGPITGSDGSTNVFDTLASEGATLLIKNGIPADSIQMVPAHEVGRDRTYSSAVALRDWFQAHGMQVHSFNIFTEDAHARRTRMLFQEAFGPQVDVGVIAIPDPDYDPAHWWRYSEGVRVILGESIAYLYARLLFHPPAAPAGA